MKRYIQIQGVGRLASLKLRACLLKIDGWKITYPYFGARPIFRGGPLLIVSISPKKTHDNGKSPFFHWRCIFKLLFVHSHDSFSGVPSCQPTPKLCPPKQRPTPDGLQDLRTCGRTWELGMPWDGEGYPLGKEFEIVKSWWSMLCNVFVNIYIYLYICTYIYIYVW